jgi:putative membrane protein
MAPKEQLAENRTDMAEDRTILAVERAFSGWIRTSLGTVGVAIALQAVFGPFQPTWIPKAAATVFLIAAELILWGSLLENRKSRHRLSNHTARLQPGGRITLVVALLSLGIMAIGTVLWWL